MTHHWINFIHSFSFAILLGAGLTTACVMYYGHRTRNVQIIAAIARYVVFAGWLFISASAVVMLVTGLILAHWSSHALLWFGVAMLCWCPIVYLQIKMRDFAMHAAQFNTKLPQRYYLYFSYWVYLSWPTLISLLIVFYLMTNKPIL